MHIGFLILNIRNSGGTERVTTIIGNELSKKGYDISIISCREGENSHFPIEKSIQLLSLHGENIRNSILRKLKTFLQLKTIIKEQKIEVMIAVDVAFYIYLLPLQMRGYCRCIAWEHFNYHVAISKLVKISKKLAARYANHLVVLGQEDLKTYQKYNKKIRDIRCIYNPLVIQNKKKSDISSKCIVSIGRLEPEKGFDRLIDIWERVERRNTDWILKIYGDGSLRGKLQRQINDKHLKRIYLCGYAENVEAKYLEASIFALTSRYEGFGLVLIEAQAKGLPCISFKCEGGGPKEIIEDGVNGFLIENDNLDQYAAKLMELMENSNLREKMSLNAKNNLEKYDVDMIIQEWEKIL